MWLTNSTFFLFEISIIIFVIITFSVYLLSKVTTFYNQAFIMEVLMNMDLSDGFDPETHLHLYSFGIFCMLFPCY